MDAVERFRKRRQRRLDAKWHEGDRLRDEKGRFAPMGGADVPEKLKKIVDTEYYDRTKKIDEMVKVMGRMKIGTTFHLEDDRGVLHRYEKADKGDDGWKVRVKTKNGWSEPMEVKRSQVGARILAQKRDGKNGR